MNILYLLIPISLIIVLIAFIAFRWAIKNDQFDDMKSPGMIPLLDDTDEELARNRRPQRDPHSHQEEHDK